MCPIYSSLLIIATLHFLWNPYSDLFIIATTSILQKDYSKLLNITGVKIKLAITFV